MRGSDATVAEFRFLLFLDGIRLDSHEHEIRRFGVATLEHHGPGRGGFERAAKLVRPCPGRPP